MHPHEMVFLGLEPARCLAVLLVLTLFEVAMLLIVYGIIRVCRLIGGRRGDH